MDLFVIKKIATPFLLMPGIFILLLTLLGFWGLTRARLGGSLACLAAAAAMWFLAIPPVADRLQGPLEAGLTIPEAPSGDVIIMMGGAVYELAPDLSGTGVPSEGTWDRIVTTARLQRKLGLPVILSGGQVMPGRKPMGPIYSRMLTDLGVPRDRILIEGDSRDTIENALFSKALCEAKGYRHPIVVTSAGHMKRTLLCFEKAAFPVTGYPCGFRTWAGKSYLWPDYLPQGYENLSQALREYLGTLVYRYAY